VDHPADDARMALEEHRAYIDRIDRTIVALLGERVRLGRAIGMIKRQLDAPIRSAAREHDVLTRVRAAAAAPLTACGAERIFSVIIAETAAAQEPID